MGLSGFVLLLIGMCVLLVEMYKVKCMWIFLCRRRWPRFH